MDSFTSGYTIPLIVDIAVRQTPGGPVVSWNDGNLEVVSLRESGTNQLLPVPAGHAPLHFVWKTQHVYEIPKGYSAIATHPLNRFDLPFTTLSGIIDDFVVPPGNVPVFFSNTFEGVIPAGTPILQVIPFKQESWTNQTDEKLLQQARLNNFYSMRAAYGWYKKNIWKKKTFN